MLSSSTTNKSRTMHHHHQHQPLCTRTHQIGALILVAATFFFTRLLNAPCSFSSAVSQRKFVGVHPLLISEELTVKIYVYDENEIDGLKELLKGRDGKITPEACLKGQWGSQVISLYLLFITQVSHRIYKALTQTPDTLWHVDRYYWLLGKMEVIECNCICVFVSLCRTMDTS